MTPPDRASLSDQSKMAAHWDSRETIDGLRAEVSRLRVALEKIDRLQAKWEAPARHKLGDPGEAAWAAVGSEAHGIAREALNGGTP